ncbi:hypothetical protein [Vibrio fluvialis]|uniref:hypothetical protein n=1 Tax=Vibrio fluvialis TaxID=676 RepID=UPI003D7DADC7
MNQATQIGETVKISSDGLYRGVSVHVPFPLENSDFLKLTKVNSLLPIWAHAFFTGTSVFVITVIAKWIDNKYYSGPDAVSTTEWLTLGILALLALIFEALYLCLPSDKKKTISKIEEHFKSNIPKAAGFENER